MAGASVTSHLRNTMATKRKLTGAAALLLLLLVAGATWWLVPHTARPYRPVGPGQVYLALGDSLAWGFRLAQRETESYPALLHKRLAAGAPNTLVNLSVPGETS